MSQPVPPGFLEPSHRCSTSGVTSPSASWCSSRTSASRHPGETIVIVASVYAGAGRMNIAAVAAIAILAAVVGDNVGYAIGRFGGRALVLRFGPYVWLTEERLAKTEGFFTRHGEKIDTVARFAQGRRRANGIIAALLRHRRSRSLS